MKTPFPHLLTGLAIFSHRSVIFERENETKPMNRIRTLRLGFILMLFMCAATHADTLFVSYNVSNTIEEFSSSGTHLRTFASGLSGPHGLAFDHSGNLYVAQQGNNTIEKFSPTGTDLGAFVSTGLSSPSGLAFDSSGNLYVTNYGAVKSIQKFSADGTYLGAFTNAALYTPYNLALDRSGNVYSGSGTIEKFSSSGADLGHFSTGYGSTVLAFDASGNLYATSGGMIQKLSPAGADLGQFGGAGLANPQNMAFDSSGNFYVTSASTGSIRKYSPNGVDLGIFAADTQAFVQPHFIAILDDSGQPLPLPPQLPSLSSGLVAYYPFNGNANDASGNGNNGTVHGATLATDRFGNANSAYSFDGVSNFISISDNPLLALSANFTICAWYYQNNVTPDPGYGVPIVNKETAGIADGYGIYAGSMSDRRTSFIGSSELISPGNFDVAQWHHIAVTTTGSVSRMYVDGLEVTSHSGGSPPTNTLPLFIGAPHVGCGGGCGVREFFNGRIDDVRIYNRALFAAEVAVLAILPVPPTIATQPQSQTKTSGSNVTFSVSANGIPSPTFQWRWNGANIAGATGSTLTVNNAQLANAGNYTAVASNSAGQAISTAAKLTVVSNVNALTVPISPSYSVLPPRNPMTDSLVLVTHGLEPIGFPDQGTWIDDMHDRIAQRLTNQTNWSVQAWRWPGASLVTPDTALTNAQEAGYNVGKQIVDQGWSHVHLIGHSAGSALIQSAAQYIKAKTSITVHLTFLDPYMGWNEMWRHLYGLHADWSDNYLSHDTWTNLKSGLTEGPVDHAYNVDVSWRDPNKSTVNQYCPSAGSTAPTACGQIAVSSHQYPHDFYNASVVPGNDPYFPVYGFARSKEAGGWDTRMNYIPGNAPFPLGGSQPGPQGTVSNSSNPNLQFSVTPSATSSTGSIQVAGSTLSLSTAGSVPIQLTPNMPGSAKSRNAAPVLQPTGTAWISVAVDVSSNVNFVTFNAQFNSASGAAGLLSVYWNDVQIGMIDERYFPGGLQSFTFPIDSAYLDRNNSLSFRLDQFSGVTSSIGISDVQTGFAGLPVAPALAISNMVPAIGLVLTLSGTGGFTYHVEASSDLAIWEPVAEVTITTGVLTPFADPDAASFVKRFYRAVSP